VILPHTRGVSPDGTRCAHFVGWRCVRPMEGGVGRGIFSNESRNEHLEKIKYWLSFKPPSETRDRTTPV